MHEKALGLIQMAEKLYQYGQHYHSRQLVFYTSEGYVKICNLGTIKCYWYGGYVGKYIYTYVGFKFILFAAFNQPICTNIMSGAISSYVL